MSDHNEKVEELKGILRELNLPNLPPHIVHNELYRPDACTRINSSKFTTLEYINSDYGFDVLGQFSLAYEKDIIEYAVCIVSQSVLKEQGIEKFNRVIKEVEKLDRYCNLQGRLVILKENEFKNWLKERVYASELWKTEDLEVIT